MRAITLVFAVLFAALTLLPQSAEADLRLREVAVSYPGDVPVNVLLEPNPAGPGYRLAQPIRFALDTRGRIRNANKRKYAIVEADLSLYAPGYPKPPDPDDNPSSIPIMRFGDPRADIEKRNTLSWTDDNLTFAWGRLSDICRERDNRRVQSFHNAELRAIVRVMGAVRKGLYDYDQGGPYTDWMQPQTKWAHTALPVRLHCPAERSTVGQSGGQTAADWARERINVDRIRLAAIPLNPGACPRRMVVRAELEGRGRGTVKYELRNSQGDKVRRHLSSLERRPDNRFYVRYDHDLTFNGAIERDYWVQAIGDPENTRSQPIRISVRCGSGPSQNQELTLGSG